MAYNKRLGCVYIRKDVLETKLAGGHIKLSKSESLNSLKSVHVNT